MRVTDISLNLSSTHSLTSSPNNFCSLINDRNIFIINNKYKLNLKLFKISNFCTDLRKLFELFKKFLIRFKKKLFEIIGDNQSFFYLNFL
jgi:hypothetical protein